MNKLAKIVDSRCCLPAGLVMVALVAMRQSSPLLAVHPEKAAKTNAGRRWNGRKLAIPASRLFCAPANRSVPGLRSIFNPRLPLVERLPV